MENECAHTNEGISMTLEPLTLQEALPAPRCIQDESTAIAEEMETVNLSDDPVIQKHVLLSKHLTPEERNHLISLLKEFKDVFSWSYEEMPGLDPKLVCHTLNVESEAKPVVQSRRNYHPNDEMQIKQEIEKLLASGFIKPINHPTWLANIVPVKKKNGQVRVCIDFRDLNKACPKDEFPLPNMDILIDSTAGQGMLSFMDGFSGYNQIKMATRDAEKTAFRTPYGNFYYTVMPFGLKNAGATYQRAMTAIFHDMMGKEVEDYVDDLVVKSRTRGDHWSTLRKVLGRCRLYNMRMNPKKYSFGVSSGKFLGFIVYKRGIDVDPNKVKAIASTAPPSSQKELKSFLGKLSYIRRFIPGLAAAIKAFTPLLKKGTKFMWNNECKKTYEMVQKLITRLPTMKAPIPGVPLKIYLAATDTAIGALLAQDDGNGVEHPVYYVSRLLGEAESRYPSTERVCLTLIYEAQRLRHYFLAHKLHLMVKTDPVRYLLTKPVLSGRLARWLLQLSEFDIECVSPRAIKGQAVIDMLALFPGNEEASLMQDIPGGLQEMVGMLIDNELESKKPWTLFFDGSATSNGGGAGVVLTDPTGNTKAISFKLRFPCTNNIAEYEAFVIGMSTAIEMGVKRINVIGDSNLVISQMKGDFAVKEATLAPYRTMAEKLVGMFDQAILEHIPGATNRYADALATLGSKLSFTNEQPNVVVVQRTKPSTEALILPEVPETDDWWNSVKGSLASQGKEINLKTLKDYVILHEELYIRLSGGILARCICEKEARQRLHEVHEATCGLEQVISLYRRLQRKGYYWPKMKEQASEIQTSCLKCSMSPSEEEVFAVAATEDWRTPYLMFLINNTLPTDTRYRYKLKKTSKRYFVDGEVLYRKGFNGEPLRCLNTVESMQVLNEVHAGECGEHQGKRKLYQQLLSLGYYWPTMQKDAHLKVKKCHTCQAHANLSHKPLTLLQDMRTP
ncbi:hypothetical protein M0R45_019525 [Rubus argutus]|uniref:RNase H type-1 domain-containing protein n=3 Tax=Rubus argutus TaxID=59490 RepID=A0AAW1X962_RUBAR